MNIFFRLVSDIFLGVVQRGAVRPPVPRGRHEPAATVRGLDQEGVGHHTGTGGGPGQG